MARITNPAVSVLASVAVLGFVPAALGHGSDMDMGIGVDTDMNMTADEPQPDYSYPPNYFALEDHRAAIYTHIALMVVAWVFMLPAAVMLSLARSRYTLVLQFVFVATNAFGVLAGAVYNGNTPDLYPNNAHHKLGWIVTCVVLAQVVIGLLGRVAGTLKSNAGQLPRSGERASFIPVSTEALEAHERIGEPRFPKLFRLSNDSGQGTERNTESLRSHSPSSSGPPSPPLPLPDAAKEYDENEDDDELDAHLPAPTRRGTIHALASKVANKLSSRSWKVMLFAYNFVDRTILILGSIALSTGIVTFGRFFEGSEIFNGLAHWIKGGVFFWLGVVTIGRWAGSFGDLGWAWNIRPRTVGQKWAPSAEFVESALIFVYGSTNIFLEHLGNWGGAYSAQDLEHISITVLFIGGGLCGMLIESSRIRDLLNMTVTEAAHSHPKHAYREDEACDELIPPRQYSFSMNPIPALVILLLGIMMSSHTQGSMISAMVHKQWGNLLAGASVARAFTYVIMYLKPPKSVLPSRPPTELLTGFGQIAGGIIFMASSRDTINGMIHYELDAMFMYTVTMGLVGLLMAWIIVLIAIKGWAIRKEAGRPISAYQTA